MYLPMVIIQSNAMHNREILISNIRTKFLENNVINNTKQVWSVSVIKSLGNQSTFVNRFKYLDITLLSFINLVHLLTSGDNISY